MLYTLAAESVSHGPAATEFIRNAASQASSTPPESDSALDQDPG